MLTAVSMRIQVFSMRDSRQRLSAAAAATTSYLGQPGYRFAHSDREAANCLVIVEIEYL